MARITAWGLLGVAVACAVCGCESGPAPRPISVEPTLARDIPPLLRGTIGTEVEFRNTDPVLVSGFGLVVGLAGTGGGQLPDNVAATMEREMGLNGVSRSADERSPLAGKTPRQVLRDHNVAVVIVQAAIPPGLPANAAFDVYVKALNATSLEGGTLWTTDLRFGPPAVFGAAQQRTVAKAWGPIFVNPFSERGREGEGPRAEVGRVLEGGWVSEPQPIVLTLQSPSWARARAMVSAINSRFPAGPGDPGDAARGRSASTIELRVPRRYRRSAEEFVRLVQHLHIDQQAPEQHARRWAEGLRTDPGLAEDLSWCLEALGPKATPFLADLYGSSELAPRMAALRAGARLGDPRAAEAIQEVARTGTGGPRLRAIELLGECTGGPRLDVALRELVAQPELSVRIAAYESLCRRAEREYVERLERREEANPHGLRLSITRKELLARWDLPRRNVQGIQRHPVEGKFLLDAVPVGDPLIYVTQQGLPRIVVLGRDADLVRPLVASAWDNRLLIKADSQGPIAVVYRPPGSLGSLRGEVEGGLLELIAYLAHKPRPEAPDAGLDLSYSDVVGALAVLNKAQVVRGAFATEQDKLGARVLAAGREDVERPERLGDEPIIVNPTPAVAGTGAPKPADPPRIVPIEAPAKK
jgi:hypothetical protein